MIRSSIVRSMLLTAMLCCVGFAGRAQERAWNDVDARHAFFADTIERGGYTLIFVNQEATFDTVVQRRMIECFFKVYPAEVKTYNPKHALRKVFMVIDTAYKGVAATDQGVMRINPEWMRKHPEDIDVVTHEAMHIVQAYPGESGPGWITEGIADFVRYRYGVNNAAAGWALPALRPEHHYENAYRITARFFVWLDDTYKKNVIVKLDQAMRAGSYKPAFWKQHTGSTLDELWKKYQQYPGNY